MNALNNSRLDLVIKTLVIGLWLQVGQVTAATFVVNSTTDARDSVPGDGICRASDGLCTLRAAIEEANALVGNDTIEIPAGVYILTRAPVGENLADVGDLDITNSVTITGAGAGVTIIDGGSPPLGAPAHQTSLDRLFEIHPTARNVELARLTLRNGWSEPEGGAIWNAGSGTLRLTEVTVQDNSATGTGGGVYSLGHVVIERSKIQGNSAGGSGGGVYNAGDLTAIGVPSRLEIRHSTFSGNQAANGAGLYNDQQGVLTVEDTTFSENRAEGYGGGLAAGGQSSVTLTRASFLTNSATGDGAGAATSSGRSVTIRDSVFTGNSAGMPTVLPDGTVELNDGNGGGLHTDGLGTVDVRNSTFSANTATEEGGGLFVGSGGAVSISDSIVRNNRALAGGGGVEVASSRVTFTRLKIFGNKTDHAGGGIEANGSGDFTILDTSIYQNTAQNGGGIAQSADARLLLSRCAIYDNRALVGTEAESGLGGGIYILGDAPTLIENTTVSGNSAQVSGGGVHVDADAGVRFVNCTITGNSAPHASGVGDEGTNLNLPITPSTAVIFRNTIVAGNRLSPSCNFALGSEGGNIEDADSCYFRGPRDRVNTDPALDAIADNGGPTPTHALRSWLESLAVDGGVLPCPLTDQRGVPRPQGAGCDSGAFEFEGPFGPLDVAPPNTMFVGMQMDDGGLSTSFRFDGSDDTTPADLLRFECRLIEHDPAEPPEPFDPNAPPDPAFAFVGCPNPWKVPALEEGHFTLEVRAIDRAGNVDPTPARHEFTIELDVTPPNTFFTATPPNPSDGRFAVFTFSGSDNQTPAEFLEFECLLDSNDPDLWLECANPMVFANLTAGTHTLRVRATDLGDNIDPTPATFTWTVASSDCNLANVTLNPVADAYVDEMTPFENFVIVPGLTVRSGELAANARALIRFPLENEGTNCQLQSATLRLYAGSSSADRTLQAIPLAGAWAENQVTWNNQPATTNTPVTTTSGDGYREWNVTAHVAAMLAGQLPNHGWLIRDATENEAEGGEQNFDSRETPQDPPPITLPQLVIRYVSSGTPPVPPPQAEPVPAFVFCGQILTESTVLLNDLIDCQGEALVIGAHNIIVDLNGHTLSSGLPVDPGQETGLPAGIRNAGYHNVTIRNGTVKNFGYGVRVMAGANFNVLENLTLHANLLAGLELFAAGPYGNVIRTNTFTANGESGLSVSFGSEGSVIANNTFAGNGGVAIHLWEARGHRIESNVITGITDPALGTDSDAGIVLDSSPDNVIRNNTVSDTGDGAIIVESGSHRTWIEGNTAIRPGDSGVVITLSDGSTVLSNVTHLASGGGISLDGANHTIVRGNDVRFNPNGVSLTDASDNVIDDNNVSYSLAAGIEIGGSSLRNQIVHNIANLTGSDGIAIEVEALDANGNPMPGNLIQGNTANENRGDGISVAAGGHVLAGNAAHNNAGFGIRAAEGVNDGGGNAATGNGESEQCTGVTCNVSGSIALTSADTTAPDTLFTVVPTDPSDSHSVRFSFAGTDNMTAPGALRFFCRLDPQPDPVSPAPEPPDPGELPEPVDPTNPDSWTECFSPMVVGLLEPGTHTFQVRAVDWAGNIDFSHASHTWTVANLSTDPEEDRLPPNTTITQSPGNVTGSDSVTFSFRGSDNITPGANLRYECRLDSQNEADFVPCISPVAYTGLAGGAHKFEVRAIDLAGNADLTPSTHVWTRDPSANPQAGDTTAPETTIVSAPHVATVNLDATFTFSASEPNVTFACSLDGAAFAACTEPVSFDNLAVGAHVFRVRATDALGNTDPTPAEFAWTIGPAPVPRVVACGEVLTESTRVMNDLFDCPGAGLVIGAAGITVDLDGHVIDGTGLGAGIRNDGFAAVTIRNGSVQEFDFGVQLHPGTALNLIESLTAQLNQEAGIQLSNADDGGHGNTIRNNTITQNSGAGIALLDGTQGALVFDNIIASNPGEGVRLIGSSSNRVAGNYIIGSSTGGVLLERADGNTIVGNTLWNNSGDGIAITLSSSGNRVEDNALTESESGIHVLDSTGNELLSNNGSLMGGPGIALQNAHQTLVVGNDLRFNSDGIELRNATGNRLESNTTSENSGSGIALEDFSLNNTVVLNSASANDGDGIHVGDEAPPGLGNVIDRNFASYNVGDGIHVSKVGHIILNNAAVNNGGWGIYAAAGTIAGVNIDGGGNIGLGNEGGTLDPVTLDLLQCLNVVCDGGTPLRNDQVSPNTSITAGPTHPTWFTSATFHFTGSDNQTAVQFQCRLDGPTSGTEFVACTSPMTYTGLAAGAHTFEVRAIDFSGNMDPTPAVYTWTIETPPTGVAPETTIVSGPDPTTVSTSATFAFAANEPDAWFECSLDGAEFTFCTSPVSLSGLGVGSHQFLVRSVDAEYLTDPTPAIYEWTVGAAPVAATVSCGQVLTQSTRVMNDLFDCPGNGLVIGAHGITVDLNGRTIDGIGLGVGILNNGFDATTVRNGVVQEFDFGGQLNQGSELNILELLTLQLNQEAGLQLSNADRNTVRANDIVGNALGIALLDGTEATRVQNNTVSGSADHGLHVLGASHNHIAGNVVTASSKAGLALEGAASNTIFSNTFTANSGGGILIGADLLPANGNLVERNIITDNSEGILVDGSTNTALINNLVQSNDGGISLDNAHGSLLRGNTVLANAGGIELSQSTSNRLEANSVNGSNGNGIAVESLSLNNVLLLNMVSGNNGQGIYIGDVATAGARNLLDRNTVNSSGGNGIFVAGGGHTVVGNSAAFNDGWGIYAEAGTVDGGGNSALGNAEPAQCYGIQCEIGTPPGAPETLIVARPENPSNSRSATFTFTGSDDTTATWDLGFQCRLDSQAEAAWVDCENPWVYANLTPGTHTFEVRAMDLQGNVDPTPATYTWTYVALPVNVAPNTLIELAPPLASPLFEGFFKFSATEPDVTFECSLDGAPFTPCANDPEMIAAAYYVHEFQFEDWEVGTHTFLVRAIDSEGNIDPTPAAYTWRINGLLVTISSGPAFIAPTEPGEVPEGGETNSTSATFEFAANVADATFMCSLDFGEFVPCTSPLSYSGLAVGEHLLRIIAADPEGNLVQVEPTEYAWTVVLNLDTTPPQTIVSLAPASGSSDMVFTFTGTDNVTPAARLTFECRLDSALEADWFSCVSPFNLLSEFPEFAPGTHTLEVHAIDEGEGGVEPQQGLPNVDPTPVSHTWTSVPDSTAPETVISSGPPTESTLMEVQFTFGGSDNATPELALVFECSLNGAPFEPCSSPATYSSELPGAYQLAVRTVDLAGNADPTPATYAWTISAPVDLTPPQTTILLNPALTTTSPDASFTFHSSEAGSTFECSLDGATFTSCASPANYSNLLPGSHTFAVRAIDAAANVDSTPATYTWTVAEPPVTTITQEVVNPTESTTATFAFIASKPNVTFECWLDGTTVPCTSPVTYTGLSVGAHAFAVRATDSDGHVELTWKDADWTILSPAAPQTTIATGPEQATLSTNASFTFGGSDNATLAEALTFECSLDGAAFAPCAATVEYSGLAIGEHTFAVRAIDEAGYVDATPASYTWTIEPEMLPTVVSCGQVLTRSALVMNDLFNCPGDALVIGAAGITIDLNGHTIDGTGVGTGIRNDGFAAVTITNSSAANGIVREFEIGVLLGSGTESNVITLVRVETNSLVGILLSAVAEANVISLNTAVGNEVGLMLAEVTAGAVLFGNTVQASASQGIHVENSSGNWLEANSVTGSGGTGIAVATGSLNNVLRLNVANNNVGWGITMADGNLDGGENAATGNGQFAQCSGVPCIGAPDLAPPDTTLVAGPEATTTNTIATFAFSSSEPDSTFLCSLDGAAWSPCASPIQYPGLSVGTHSFAVAAVDAAGNVDQTPASYSWTINPPPDTTPPETTITSGPAASTTSAGATFAFSSSEPGSTFQCSLDGAPWAPCTSPMQYTGLSAGSHVFRVIAVDAAGNVDQTPASHSWTITSLPALPPVTVTANADAWIDQNSPGNNKGSDSILKVTAKSANNNTRALVRFNLPTVPQGYVIQSVSLRIYSASATTGRTIQALRATANWTQNGVTWNNQPATTGPAATTTSGTGYRQWNVTAQVQTMYDTGTNNGFVIRDATENTGSYEQQFHSRENSQNKPQLVVTFAPAP